MRQLGDRTVLYKYLNPNLIGVGIVAPADGNTDGHVQALLIDAASGRVVHDARHAGCDGPLTMVLGENWVVYEYWSPALLQHQVTVSELFTNATHTGAAADDVLSLILAGRVDYTDPANHFDSFSAAAATPHVLTQTYAFGAAVAAMAVTQTAAGIAPKYVMHLTASGMLMSMDKRMLDPRRPLVNPKSMSAADREEGLVPYSPSLGGVNPLLVASHRNTIARPRALLCAPATLESTSLVAAVGLDLYLTRVAPAREFDRLNEDFNYVALLGSIVVLVVASWGTQWMIKRRELNRAWKRANLRGTVSTIVTQRRGSAADFVRARGRLDELKAEIDLVEAWSSSTTSSERHHLAQCWPYLRTSRSARTSRPPSAAPSNRAATAWSPPSRAAARRSSATRWAGGARSRWSRARRRRSRCCGRRIRPRGRSRFSVYPTWALKRERPASLGEQI